MADSRKEERIRKAREELAALLEKKRVLDETRHRTSKQMAEDRRGAEGDQ